MIAKTKDQVKTVTVLEMVFDERVRQNAQHGDAMVHMEDGTGPTVQWLYPINTNRADIIEKALRRNYDITRAVDNGHPTGALTRMHLVREEIAEAFEREGDDPEFIAEIIQVAALCVQWVEIKLGG